MKKLDELLVKSKYAQMQMPYCELLHEDEIKLLYDHCNFVVFKHKEVVIRQGTPVSHIMFMRSGFAKVSKEGRNGNFIILKVEKAGNFVGMLSVFSGDIHKYSVSAIDEIEIGFIDIQTFNEVIKKNGVFAYKIITALSNYGLFIFDRLISQSHKQLPGRVADVILYFAEEIYHNHKFDFPFTRTELAQLAGTTKESFIRTLTEFKNDKIIKLDGSQVEIISIENIKLLSRLG